MQPLDVLFLVPLAISYGQEVECFLHNHPLNQIAKIFDKAYLRDSIPTNALNGFRKTYPVDRNVFTEDKFSAVQPTDVPEEIPVVETVSHLNKKYNVDEVQ